MDSPSAWCEERITDRPTLPTKATDTTACIGSIPTGGGRGSTAISSAASDLSNTLKIEAISRMRALRLRVGLDQHLVLLRLLSGSFVIQSWGVVEGPIRAQVSGLRDSPRMSGWALRRGCTYPSSRTAA